MINTQNLEKLKKKQTLCSPYLSPSSLKPLAITDFFIVSVVLSFPERHVVEIIQPFQVSFFGLMCIEISRSATALGTKRIVYFIYSGFYLEL